MTEHVHVGGLQVAKVLFDFVNNEAIPGTGLTADQFWAGADKVINDLAPKNKALLAKRDDSPARRGCRRPTDPAPPAVGQMPQCRAICVFRPHAADALPTR